MSYINRNSYFRGFDPCPYCNTNPGETHLPGCEVERCSFCGDQRIDCSCAGHDPVFSRWTGIIPGLAEVRHLGVTLMSLDGPFKRALFTKPSNRIQFSTKFDLANINGLLDDYRAHLAGLNYDNPWRNPTLPMVDASKKQERDHEAASLRAEGL